MGLYPLSSSVCLRMHLGCLMLPGHQIQLLHCHTQSSLSHVGDDNISPDFIIVRKGKRVKYVVPAVRRHTASD